jgi:serine/threonine protein kinase
MALTSGTKLGSYEILSPLGAGGMDEVYRAWDLRLRRDVAIKILPAFVASDPDRLRRFEQEATAAAALNHPNILAVYQMGTYQGAPYLVSELLEGETLRELIKRGPMAMPRAMDYGMEAARGLAAAHETELRLADLQSGKTSTVPGSQGKLGAQWMDQHTLVARHQKILDLRH